MATGTYTAWPIRGRGSLERWVGTSAADTALTTSTSVTTPSSGAPPAVRRLLYVIVPYSATPTQAGVTVVFNSGAGAAYDTILDTGAANEEDGVYEPTTEILILPDDAIDVIAPAGGGVITSSISIYTERL